MICGRLSVVEMPAVGGVSLELAALSELRPRSPESELRELASAPPTPSAAGALLFEPQVGGDHDFILRAREFTTHVSKLVRANSSLAKLKGEPP
jgi:hypothetical protein